MSRESPTFWWLQPKLSAPWRNAELAFALTDQTNGAKSATPLAPVKLRASQVPTQMTKDVNSSFFA
jgi:hypothetical protein